MTVVHWNHDGEDFGYFGYPLAFPGTGGLGTPRPLSDRAKWEEDNPRPREPRLPRQYLVPKVEIPKIERKTFAPAKLDERLFAAKKEAPLGTTNAASPNVSEALSYLTSGALYKPSDVSVDVDSSRIALLTYLKTRIEHDFALGSEVLANQAIYGMDDRIYSAYRKLCMDRQDDFVKGITAAEEDRLNGQIQREKIKGSICNDLIPARASIISSVVPQQARVAIANAEMATEESIATARRLTAYNIAVENAALRLAIANANAGTRLAIAEANAGTQTSMAAADAATRLDIAARNAETRASMSAADLTTRENIADAGKLTQIAVAEASAEAMLRSAQNSYEGYAFSAAASWAYGLAHILAAGASQMGKPGIAWVE